VERSKILREKILRAAAEIVGEFGYQDASIGRIALAAGIAQGTIYLYFDTRQALFDELLPNTGQDMMRFIGERLRGAKNFIDVEERGINAFFEYLEIHPGFYRLLNEAEFAAPKAHQKHFAQLLDHYVASMQQSINDGTLEPISVKEQRAIAYMLMSARSYFYAGYVKYGGTKRPPAHVIEAYLKIVQARFKPAAPGDGQPRKRARR